MFSRESLRGFEPLCPSLGLFLFCLLTSFTLSCGSQKDSSSAVTLPQGEETVTTGLGGQIIDGTNIQAVDGLLIGPDITAMIDPPDNCVSECMLDNQDDADPDICSLDKDAFDTDCETDCKKNVCVATKVFTDPTHVPSFKIPEGTASIDLKVSACIPRSEVLLVGSSL